MCVILDNCLAADFANKKPELVDLEKYFRKGGSMVYSPELFGEYPKKMYGLIAELGRAGKAKLVKLNDVALDTTIIESNDIHILKLAIKTGVRALCSVDQALINDFKNTQVISPKGKVYKGAESKNVLTECECASG